MRYFLDFEFMEDGRTIDPLSIGIVAEDRREYYAEFPFNPEKANEFVRKNVIPKLKGPPWIKSREMVAQEVLTFVTKAPTKPEFWGYYADYDWVCFCQLWGRMVDLPKPFPFYCRDIKQMADNMGNPKLPEQSSADEHNALYDARWNRESYLFLSSLSLKRLAALKKELPKA